MKIKYYKVGGAVRDILINPNAKPKDIDFAVEAPSYEAMKQDLLNRGVKIFQEREQYFAIRGSHPDFGGVDYVLCRRDGFYTDGRRPDDVEAGTLLDDLSRRDFCHNAIARDEETGEIIDPFDGRKDIQNKIVRCVGVAEDRFNEDGLRLLRAIRFSITLKFSLHESIWNCLYTPRYIDLLDNVSEERIYDELSKMFRFDTLRTLDFLNNFLYLRHKLFKTGIWLKPTMETR